MTKNKIISIFIMVFMLSSFLPAKATETTINISPIVQIISYYDVYGKYPMMMGWGSASIITKDGVIISNDHVVDDGKGALASAFSVCVTKKISEKPVCDYTASLISRDDKLDISVLRIDPIDIYGNNVDYNKFKTIDIDYDYEPKNQDETIAIGYPWIGADTISETKGIVSGISEYNGYKYIKTDTLIAGGNSGGAFVKNDKLIGIPTFGIGWGDSMGYALSIKEAQDFIEKNKKKESNKNPITSLIDFNSYRKTIENINSNLALKDDVFDIKLSPDYQVSNYIKNTTLNIELKKQKDTGVQYLSIYIEKGPKLDNDKKKFYYLEKEGFYNKEWQKLLKKSISGIEFYYPVDKTDLSAGDSNWGNNYKSIIGNYIITINLQAPLYDEKRNKEVKKEVEAVLSSIKINKDNINKISTKFSTNEPKIDITDNSDSISDTGRLRLYLSSNLYEYANIYLNELVEYNGKGKSAKEIYNVQLKDVDKFQKSLITFKGLDGFINCSGNGGINSYYNYYNYYDYNYYNPIDENGNTIELESCDINIFFPLNKELNRQNYLSISIKSLKNNRSKNLEKVIKYITENVNVYTTVNTVNIPNILNKNSLLKYNDIKKQSTAYKNFLSLLIRYNMIENKDNFEGNSPIKWGEFLYMYSKWLLNFNIDSNKCINNDYQCKFKSYKIIINGVETNLDNIFNEIGIDDYNDYIDSNKINYGANYSNFLYDKSFFDRVLLYKLAGLDNIGQYTVENIINFEKNSSEEQYEKSKNKVEEFLNKIYGNKKILISDFYTNYDPVLFTQKTLVYYPDNKKLLLINSINNDKISFSSKQSYKEKEYRYFYETFNKCILKNTYLDYYKCNIEGINKYNDYTKKYNEINDYDGYYYYPLSKAEAIRMIFTQVDFGLFDTDLAKKKETEIEDTFTNNDIE